NSSRLTDPHLPYPGARDCPGRRHPGSTPLRRASPASSLANTSTIRPRARPTCPMADLPSPARPRPCSPRLASPQHPRASPPTCLGQPRPSLRRPRATCLPRPPIANPAPCDVPTLSVTALGDMPARPDTTRAPPPSQPDRPCQLHSAHRPAPPGLRPTCPSRSPPFGPARRAMPFRTTSLPGPTDRFHAPRTYPARAHPITRPLPFQPDPPTSRHEPIRPAPATSPFLAQPSPAPYRLAIPTPGHPRSNPATFLPSPGPPGPSRLDLPLPSSPSQADTAQATATDLNGSDSLRLALPQHSDPSTTPPEHVPPRAPTSQHVPAPPPTRPAHADCSLRAAPTLAPPSTSDSPCRNRPPARPQPHRLAIPFRVIPTRPRTDKPSPADACPTPPRPGPTYLAEPSLPRPPPADKPPLP